MSECLAEGQRARTLAWHQRNLTICLACGHSYCQSCTWGCAACGFGAGMDRRAEGRRWADLTVTITPDEEGR